MKVVCIDSTPRIGDIQTGLLQEGKVYTVICECNGFDNCGNNYPCYVLEEFDGYLCFERDRFIPCSGIDELELVNELEYQN